MQLTLLRFVNLTKAEQLDWLASSEHTDNCRGDCCLELMVLQSGEPELIDVDIDGSITKRARSELVRTIGMKDDDVERTIWEEYRLASAPNADAVHRSVDVILKKASASGNGAAASFK